MSELQKIRRHLRIITVLIILLFGLLIASYIHQGINPKAKTFPNVQVVNGKDGKDGQTPKIDYSKINSYIQTQIASLPQPQNGVNGTNGKDGSNGLQGKQGKTGSQGAQGIQGASGVSGKNIELRHNDEKHQTEWRYSGEFTWILLFKDCQITNTCGVL